MSRRMSQAISDAFYQPRARGVVWVPSNPIACHKERAQQRATEAAATQAQAPQARPEEHARRMWSKLLVC